MTTKELKEREAAEGPAPSNAVSIPAGSFKLEDLEKGLEGATSKSDDKREEAVAKVLDEANQTEIARNAGDLTPGDVVKEVTREDLGVTEQLRVYVPPRQSGKTAAAEDAANAKSDATDPKANAPAPGKA